MSHPKNTSRRNVITQLGAAGLAVSVPHAVQASIPTPSQPEGPFYPTSRMRFDDQDADLVRIARKVTAAGGEVIWLRGEIRNKDNALLVGALIEIWQVDMNGRYIHTGDRGANGKARDAAFQGYGQTRTDDKGQFAFRTIKPAIYPGRAPHIHAKITAGASTLTTQFYIADHPANAQDGSFRRLSKQQQAALSMTFQRAGGEQESYVTIRL